MLLTAGVGGTKGTSTVALALAFPPLVLITFAVTVSELTNSVKTLFTLTFKLDVL